MSRISGIINEMNKRTFYKERQINKRCINFLSKQNIKVPLILDMLGRKLAHRLLKSIVKELLSRQKLISRLRKGCFLLWNQNKLSVKILNAWNLLLHFLKDGSF